MKVVYFTESLPPNTDGVQRTLCYLVETLESEKVDYKFYSPFKPDKNIEWTNKVRKILSVPLILYKDYRVGIPYFSGLKSELDKFKPDIIHITSPTLLGNYGLSYAKKRDIKAVSSYHTHFISYITYYGFPKKLENIAWGYFKWFYNQFDCIYAPSPSAVKELDNHGISRVELWQRGVELSRFSPKHRNDQLRKYLGAEDKSILLFVGRLVKEKDLDDLIKANDLLKQRGNDFKLVLVGDGPMREELEEKLPDALFAGYRHKKELSEFYASADVFVFPSTTETFGNVVLEAFASGLPAVVVNKGGVADIVNDKKDGFIAEPNNPTDFADKIEFLLNSENELIKMGYQAQITAKNYRWDYINRNLLKSYENLINAPVLN